ncbi:MAG TPA: hypothetical protein VNZ86_09800 [Bacteroidia bacterium]|jgi:hypothetical protein|nr:hypothetical protein [Bacteroidia bacterium]
MNAGMIPGAYELNVSTTGKDFEFISEGVDGDLLKIVQFSPTGIPGIFNLGFGDTDPRTGKMSDSVISNNGVSKKVLSTVALTLLKFTEQHKTAQIIAIGSTRSRTGLYQIGISNYLEEVNKLFDIYGFINNDWIPFERGHNFEAFLVRRKQ